MSESAEITAEHAQPWQKIETAPKDGTLIVGWNGEHRLMWWLDMGRGAQWVNAETAYELKRDRQPTRWMPLPDPPHAEHAQKDRAGGG